LDAGLRGVDVEKEIKKKKEKNIFKFQAPEDYEKLPESERRNLTDTMLGKHKAQFEK